MLTTVEEIEDELLKILIAHEDELVSSEERMNLIVEQGKIRLDEYERELHEYYKGQEVGTYEEEFLSSYRQAKQKIFESVKHLLEKEAVDVSSKIA